MPVVGQAQTDPVTGVAGDIYTQLAVTRLAYAGLVTPLTPGTAARNALAALAESVAWAIVNDVTAPGRPTPDASDYLWYTGKEIAGPVLNTGAAGHSPGDLATVGSTLVRPAVGVFGRALGSFVGGDVNSFAYSAAGAGVLEPSTAALTLWALVTPRSFPAHAGLILGKLANGWGVWADPWHVFALTTDAAGDGSWDVYFSTGAAGSLRQITVGGATKLVAGVTALVCATWDGTTLTAYLNGVSVGTLVPGVAMGYGAHGPWATGADSAATHDTFDGIIEAMGVSTVVRSTAWMTALLARVPT